MQLGGNPAGAAKLEQTVSEARRIMEQNHLDSITVLDENSIPRGWLELGDLIARGIALVNTTYILAGAIPAALLAIAIEIGLGRLERFVTPKGLRV